MMMIAPMLLLLAQAAAPSAADRARVVARAQPVVDRFAASVRECGARPPYKPTLRVADRDGIIRFDHETGQVVVYPWSVMGEATKADFARRASDTGQTDGGRASYEDIFNDLLVAHELGHWLQGFQPEMRTAAGQYDGWSAEYNANQIMIAFWREHPAPGRPSGPRLSALIDTIPSANPFPPPAGRSVEDFFTTDTMTIVRGGVYGWYQGLMTRRAAAEKPAPRFCTLVSRWLPLR